MRGILYIRSAIASPGSMDVSSKVAVLTDLNDTRRHFYGKRPLHRAPRMTEKPTHSLELIPSLGACPRIN